jgi:hypothetical protein
VTELHNKSKKLLEEVNSSKNKARQSQAAKEDQKREQEVMTDSKRQDDFILKFQYYANEEKIRRSHNESTVSPSPPHALQVSVPFGSRLSQGSKGSQGQNSGQSLSGVHSRISDFESLQLKSEVSDLEPNFENVRSLNFFFNPAIGSTNFIKNDYLEYVGIARNSNIGRDSGFIGSSKGKEFLKKIPQNSLVFSQNNQVIEPASIPVEDLTAPKTFQSGEKGESVFSESEEGVSEQKFPFNEEPPSESFDYFKQGDPNDRIEEDEQNRMDNFESFKNQKPIFSDYHHYNQAYLQKFYQNYAEDMDEIYRKEMHGAPEALEIRMANPNVITSSSNGQDDTSKGSSNDHPRAVRQGVYAKPSAPPNHYDDQLQQFKDDILTDDPHRTPPHRIESDKSNMPHIDDVSPHRYFSFTQEQIEINNQPH